MGPSVTGVCMHPGKYADYCNDAFLLLGLVKARKGCIVWKQCCKLIFLSVLQLRELAIGYNSITGTLPVTWSNMTLASTITNVCTCTEVYTCNDVCQSWTIVV